jgi:epoxyqueuosine reductase
MGRHLFGCDICQDVCPFNRSAPVTKLRDFQPRQNEPLFQPSLEWLAEMSEEEFRANFHGSALTRAKWKGFVRNACIALGNSGLAPDAPERGRIVALLQQLAGSSESIIAESAQWAMARIQ